MVYLPAYGLRFFEGLNRKAGEVGIVGFQIKSSANEYFFVTFLVEVLRFIYWAQCFDRNVCDDLKLSLVIWTCHCGEGRQQYDKRQTRQDFTRGK
jgi:hypothetical protein